MKIQSEISAICGFREVRRLTCVIVSLLWVSALYSDTVGMEARDDGPPPPRAAAAAASSGHERFQEILRLVEEGEGRVSNSAGQNVVIALGATGAGKSVTINCLLGARMFARDADGRVEAEPPSADSGIVLAEVGHRGSCTIRPAIYTAPGSTYSFLDTRGFEDTGMHPEGDIAASILTEMAIKNASSVRIMVVVNHGVFGVDRAKSFTGLGRILNKIVVGHQTPILFLFNRYQPPGALGAAFYRMPPAQQNQVIDNSIDQGIREVLEIEDTAVRGVVERVASRLGKGIKAAAGKIFRFLGGGHSHSGDEVPPIDEAVADDQEVRGAFSAVSYTGFLQYNCPRALLPPQVPPRHQNTAHLDPLSGESRDSAIAALGRLRPVAASSLGFTEYSTARVEFDAAFARRIESMLFLMKAKARMSKYSLALLRALAEDAGACQAYHQGVLGGLDRLGEDELGAMQDAYAVRVEDTERRQRQLRERLEGLRGRRGALVGEVGRLLGGDPRLYWMDRWLKEAGFFSGWWRNYECTYPLPVHFARWKDTLEENTERAEIVREDSPYLQVKYTSSLGSNCEGRMEVYVAPEHDPNITVLVRARRTEIAGVDREIATGEETLRSLEGGVQVALRSRIESRVRVFTEQTQRLGRAVRLREDVDRRYEAGRAEIEVCARIADKLATRKPIVEAFVEYHRRLPALLGAEVRALEDRLMDGMFGNPLLDPVQLICKDGVQHGRVYERYSIAEQLRRSDGKCPDCRELSKIVPLGPLAIELEALVDGVFGDTLASEEMIRMIQS